MLQKIYGRARSRKTAIVYELLREDVRQGKKVTLLVPDQQVFESERRISEEKIGALSLEVVGFSRLCNQVFRRYGGLCYHYIGRGAKLIVVWRALRMLSDSLTEYQKLSLDDLSILSMLQKTIEELERCKITPEQLESVAMSSQLTEENPGVTRLSRKLRDLSMIYSLDLHLLHHDYDNPEEDLLRAAELLSENPGYFAGQSVYVDGFDSFTPQESDVLRIILREADSVRVTIPCLPTDRQLLFGNIRRMDRLIDRLVSESRCQTEEPILTGKTYYENNPELSFLADRIWQFGGESYPDTPSNITLTETSDIYSEAESVACEIARLVEEENVRYREIAVIMRSTPSYEGIIDQAFEKYGIPCFSSTRTRLRMKPQIRLIESALAIVSGGWRYEDVIAYLRTGLSGLRRSDCDLVEEYATTWNIGGRLWYSDEPWNMNPEGFVDDNGDTTARRLERLEGLREQLVAPLRSLQDAFRGECTVRDASKALYDYLISVGIPDQLASEDASLRAAGDYAGAEESAQVFDAILGALDDLVTVAGDLTVGAGSYSELLATVFDSTDIGKVPARVDEIILGDPGLLHRPNIRHVFLLGLCESVFPAAPTEDSILSDDDRQRLELCNLELEDNSEIRQSRELYGVYRALSVASEKVHLSYHADLGPSVAVFAIRSLFPMLETRIFAKADRSVRLYGRAAAFEYAATHREDDCGREILRCLSADPDYRDRLIALGLPLGAEDCTLLPQTVDELMGDGLNLTQARIENFVKCPFYYYSKNILRLRESASDDFEARDIGDFIHSVFEHFISDVGFEKIRRLDDDGFGVLADRAVEDYRSRIVRGRTTARLEALFDRISDLSHLFLKDIVCEFRHSDFSPIYAEYSIDNEKGHVRPMKIEYSEGKSLTVYGIVDRIDSCKLDDRVYLRVIDYKTGPKDFRLSDLDFGMNMQMWIYLCSLCSTDEQTFRDRAGASEGDRILPAAVLYYSARTPGGRVDHPGTSGDPTSETRIIRKGLLIDDVDVLRAMEHELAGQYIPAKLKSDGSWNRNVSSVAPKEDFERIFEKVRAKIAEIGCDMATGRASALPFKRSGNDPNVLCKYCDLKTLCRHSEDSSEESPDGQTSEGGKD